MILGIVSDTHAHSANTLAAARMLESLAVDEVIHCGDIGSPEIVRLFAAWPTHFVLGNVDTPDLKLPQAIEAARQTCHGRFGRLERGGRQIAFLHGDDSALLSATIASGDYDLVCHGHTHVAALRQQGKTQVLNPGAMYRAQPHSIAVVDLDTMTVTHVTV